MQYNSRIKTASFWFLTSVLFLFPVVFLIVKSFTLPWRYQAHFHMHFTLRGWTTLLSENQLVSATFMSLLIGGVIVILNLLIGLSAGKALAFYQFKGKSIMDTLFLLPLIFPLLAIAMGVHIAMIRLGLADMWVGVVLIHLVPTIPYSIKILRNGYVSLGSNILEQSTSLGANVWNRFLTIELPLLKPALRSTIFLTFVISLSQYVITAIIGGGNVVTLAMVYFPFLQSASSTVLAAFSIWFALVPILFYIMVEFILCFLPYQSPWRMKS
ncbi:ABC transporter permease subunit [Pontibacillus yanchengensis]|uniref:ABC transporter permease subunit n=3 Tax=Pontibacillus yanchengensis TaxID=462910 RepID=A0ACC7VJW0_9BACI|nr:ABC transporter permease subunit [Pontibacillus yanchengensis]MYL35036.1 ABC transporter permease subunit [Pontibacillus yanchengensis]MYL55253.1 ABC transporter permease subunit [Pontibacillus yanchengensis]